METRKRKLQCNDALSKTTIVDFFSQPKRSGEEGTNIVERNKVTEKEKQEPVDCVILIDSSDNDDIVSTVKRNVTSLMVEHPCGPREMVGKEEEKSDEEESVHFRGQKKRVSLIDSDEHSDAVMSTSSSRLSEDESISSVDSVATVDSVTSNDESVTNGKESDDSTASDEGMSINSITSNDRMSDQTEITSDERMSAHEDIPSKEGDENEIPIKEKRNDETETTSDDDISIISINSIASNPEPHTLTSSQSESEEDDDQLRTILQENLNYDTPNVDTIIDSDSSMDCTSSYSV